MKKGNKYPYCQNYGRVIIGNNVEIGDNVYIGYNNKRQCENWCRISYQGKMHFRGIFMDFYADRENKHPLEIGANAIIRSETIIYGDVKIDKNFQCGHRVTIREGAISETLE